MPSRVRIGTAGWAIPRPAADAFPSEGSRLERYAARLNCVEINSSFYRPHAATTYARWAAATPIGFRFAVKAPRALTHEARLTDTGARLDDFLGQIAALEGRLGPILIQLPPSLAFDREVAERFLAGLRARFDGAVAWEPRHPSWFVAEAEALLAGRRIARVAADPARVPAAALPGGWPSLAYHRLHGSPRIYFSKYDEAFLGDLVARLGETGAAETWCVFDNTAAGEATADAFALEARLVILNSMTPEEARERQKAYAAKRKTWARAVGRPYTRRDKDPRPPPGELDAVAEE
ncbi:MAG TPA: DUF72 domain-containing protein [Caulobacteraceae bacterium]|nr:DUF72 domain-containing protein [Caulobacteraceae bacterium]